MPAGKVCVVLIDLTTAVRIPNTEFRTARAVREDQRRHEIGNVRHGIVRGWGSDPGAIIPFAGATERAGASHYPLDVHQVAVIVRIEEEGVVASKHVIVESGHGASPVGRFARYQARMSPGDGS